MEKERWGGAVRQPATLWGGQNERISKNGEPLAEEDHRCLEIELFDPAWWELEHWDEIYDERRSWSDLSREDQRALKRLLGKG